jgi:hypothetical protein
MILSKNEMIRLRDTLNEVIRGLGGKPFKWNGSERARRRRLLEAADVRVMTRTGIAKAGHRLKRGAKPIGQVYFGAPLSRYAEVFLLDVQTTPKPEGAPAQGKLPFPDPRERS